METNSCGGGMILTPASNQEKPGSNIAILSGYRPTLDKVRTSLGSVRGG